MVEITKEIRDAAKAEFDRWGAASGIGKTGKMFQVIRICNQGSIVDFLDCGIGYAIMGEYVFRSEMTAALATMRLEAVVAAVAPLIEAAVRAEGWRATEAARDVIAERQRQISVEGFSSGHDDDYPTGTLALAACCYARPAGERGSRHSSRASIWRVLWPWDDEWWKPKSQREDLVRAGALIIAEIERLDRAASLPAPPRSAP